MQKKKPDQNFSLASSSLVCLRSTSMYLRPDRDLKRRVRFGFCFAITNSFELWAVSVMPHCLV